MRVKGFLENVADLFGTKRRQNESKKKAVKKALKRLGRRKLELKGKLANAKDGKTERKLKSQIAVVRKQREHGVVLLKRLRRE